MTATSWPSPINVSARSRTCATTPPGTSQGYGDTSPTRIASDRHVCGQPGGVEVGNPHALQHVPVVRMCADAVGEAVGDRLGHAPDVVGAIAGVDPLHLRVEADPPPAVVPEPQRH